jgi:hypothetical protein
MEVCLYKINLKMARFFSMAAPIEKTLFVSVCGSDVLNFTKNVINRALLY